VPRTWTDPLARSKQCERDLTFGTWNVRSLYRSGYLTTAARELARYKLNLVGAPEVKWDKGGTVKTGGLYSFSVENEMKIINWEQEFCTPQSSISSQESRVC